MSYLVTYAVVQLILLDHKNTQMEWHQKVLGGYMHILGLIKAT